MFFKTDNQRGILSYQIRPLPCHARGARKSIDLCIQYKNNQTSDALIKYVA